MVCCSSVVRLVLVATVVGGLGLAAACGRATAPSPFTAPSAGGAAGAPPVGLTGGVGLDGGPDADLGAPCRDDSQCDDAIECTLDACVLALGHCQHVADAAPCDNGVYCDGEEQCDPRAGCVAGEPVACSDASTCTIDVCVEATQSCRHDARDGDGDGDPDGNCADGADCDDTDPLVSSLAAEVCANALDDDCDEAVDEAGCVVPEHDVCADFLEVTAAGTYELALAGAGANYAATCAGTGWRDVIVAFTTDGEQTVEVTATTPTGGLALAEVGLCGDAATELSCARGATNVPRGGTAARLRLDAPEAGTHVVTVFGNDIAPVTLDVEYLSRLEPLPNETCGTAAELLLEAPFVTSVVGLAADLPSACAMAEGDAVYRLDLTEPRDLEVFAVSVDGLGEPILSLFRGDCTAASDELTCRTGEPAALQARALPAGSYFLGVSASGPSDIQVRAELLPASEPPRDDTCSAPPPLVPGERVSLDFVGYADDVALDCLAGGLDAVFSLRLEAASDLRLIERLSDGDQGALALLSRDCDANEALTCATGRRSPLRAPLRDVPAGDYAVVVESTLGTPSELTALVRPAAAPLLVAFSDTCDEAFAIPAAGALLFGNSATASDDYSASCDRGGGGGAADQVLRLVLDARRRVVLDMDGSGYETVLDVRRGPSCPGEEVTNGCAAGYVVGRSYLDLVLEPGEYWVQVDGYEGATGAWALDVHVVDP